MTPPASAAPDAPPVPPPAPTSSSWPDLLPVALTAVLMAAGLWRWPLWEDEIFTQNVATELPLAKVFEMAARDRHPPGYFLLEWLIGQVGESDAWLRLPSAVATVLAVAIVARIGRRHLGVGALGAWLLPLLPFVLVYGTMARTYAILIAIGAGLLAATFLPTRRAVVAVAVLGAVGMYAHYAMALPLVAAVGALALRGWVGGTGIGRVRGLLPAAAATLGVALAFAPWAWSVASGQAGRESRQAPDLDVLMWALWPVGGLVPHVAWPMLVLALVGAWRALRGRLDAPGEGSPRASVVLAPWILAAVVLPILASTRSMTASKPYVFASLLPLFVLLCAGGIQWLVTRLSRGSPARLRHVAPAAVALSLLLLAAPDVRTVLALPAQPLELGLTSSGARDVREEIEVLVSVAPHLNPRLLDNRPWTPYQRYLPAQATPPERLWESAWVGWRRTEGAEVTARAEGAVDEACFFRRAFLNLVYVRDPETCRALRIAIAAAADARGYPPFLLQTADFARDRGATSDAEQLARLAIGGMGPSVEPVLFLARRQLERGAHDAALASVEEGLVTAVRWRDDTQVGLLYELAAQIRTAQGDSEAADDARAAVACARSDVPLWVCGGWLERFWTDDTSRR